MRKMTVDQPVTFTNPLDDSTQPGVIESIDDSTDVCGLARRAAGVNEVINHLLVRSCSVEW